MKMNFHAFTQDTIGNAWVKEPGFALYVRRCPDLRVRDRLGDYTLASMNATKPGKGALTRFLDEWEPKVAFSFENVMNMRLVAYLARRGYRVTTEPMEYPPCMVKSE
jgi:hypothetical protein